MKVFKFGGSSLATPIRIRAVARIILDASRRQRIVVVVSAFQGVTDQLLACARLAEARDASHEPVFEKIATRHRQALRELLGQRTHRATSTGVEALLAELRQTLQGVHLLGQCPPQALDLIASFGERLSALIISSYLNRSRPALFADARTFIVTGDQFTRAQVNFSLTNRAIRRYFRENLSTRGRVAVPIVTGFIGSTVDGRTTTIGRDGSDYTAAILAAALKADAIEIWTDVDGVLSADPRVVSSAFALPAVTYEEAMELSYFGAKVLHPAAIAPAVERRIPVYIRNTFRPGAAGTLISEEAKARDQIVTGISSIPGLTLITLRGLSMVGVPGVAERLFGALASHHVNVILISQASSEHTICFAVRHEDTATAIRALREEFRFELQQRLTKIDQRPDQVIIAVVGDEMKGHAGVSGRVFGALGRHGINITAIAQGASERNISFVVDAVDHTRAVNILHQSFFERRKRLALVLIGVGNIGRALLEQLRQQQAYLRSRGFDISVIAVANSKRFALDPAGLPLARWREKLLSSRRVMSPHRLIEAVTSLQLTDVAVVDCTADAGIVEAYADFVRADMHIITPNKRGNVLPWRRYAALMEQMRQRQKYFFDEANVGAGLPILSTLRDLIASGDVVTKIEGVFSGTLSYLFGNFDTTIPFSQLVRSVHANGLTEPDPRDDLSGQDVARKLLILARQTGIQMEIEQVRVQSLVPAPLARGKFSERFFVRLVQHDRTMAERWRHAQRRGCVLRYVGLLENGKGRAALKEFPKDHPIAGTKPGDNIIAFTTKRYARTPLVVQGPGAGADVTAMGVFSDILKLLNYLPH